MGDSEAVATQTSNLTGYAVTDYSKSDADVTDANKNAPPDINSSVAETSEDSSAVGSTLVAPNAMDYNSSVVSENLHNTDLNSGGQEASNTMAYDSNEKPDGLSNMSGDPSEVGNYGSSMTNNVNEARENASAGIVENGVSSDDVHGSATMHQPLDSSALSAEEERLWSIVKANSLEFNAWTALIEETEKTAEGNILKIRRVYDAFLAEFPLCYGYWKKYADHEARHGSIEKVVEVYERAVQGVTYSVDMWLHYCVFAISTYGDPDIIRSVSATAITLLHGVKQDWSRVAVIYTRVLEIPNQQLDRYFEGFKELVASRPLSELRTAEETAAANAVSSSEVGGPESEGEVHPNAVEQASNPVSASLKDAEELEKYIAIREEIYKKAKEFDSKIIGFETAIKRPYFHVRPLNPAELENWHHYLDFIEGEGDLSKIVKLYERCLIACANYPEYWMRYVLFMEDSGNTELADNALARATQVFVKRQPDIHLFAGRLREQRGDIPGARAAYQLVHAEIAPGLLEAIIKHANMEHRLGNLEHATTVYEEAIAIEKGKEHSQTLPLLLAQYSRFLYLVLGKVEKSREILDQAVENGQLSKPLLEALIHLESIQSLPKRIDYLDSLVEKFIVPSHENSSVATLSEREDLSSIFLEFLDLFGDAQSIKKADHRHVKLFLNHKSTPESKKRHAEDCLTSDKSKLAKPNVASSVPSVMGAYPNVQNQWQAGYGVQPQAWPPASQVQAQQWNPNYAQQAAYNAYGSYGSSYANPQVATSVPQTATYGAYPPTYPAQTVPQQSYSQPAAAAVPSTLTAAQQPAAVAPSAYYGSYY